MTGPTTCQESVGFDFAEQDASGGPLGLIIAATICGTLAAIASVVVGAPWWTVLALYSAVGGLVALLLAVRMAIWARWPAQPPKAHGELEGSSNDFLA